jgi:glutathione S-transferase
VPRTMRVFHREHAGRPIRVVWMLEELGEPYELTMITRDEGAGEEHHARHPLGRVPVLDDGQGFVFESAAICLQLADMYPQAALAPVPGTHERALVYQWACFVPAELEPPLIEAAVQAQRDPARATKARERFDAATAAVAEALGEDEYLVGASFGVADVMIGTALGFTKRAGFAEDLPANLQQYIARLAERGAYKRAFARTSA